MKNFLQVNRALKAKKNFNFNFKHLFVLSAVLLLGSTQAWGTDTEITINRFILSGETIIPINTTEMLWKDEISFSVNETPSLSNNVLQVSEGKTATISAHGKTITSIVIVWNAANNSTTVNTGAMVWTNSNKTMTWTGSATSVAFTSGVTTRMNSVVVTYTDDDPLSGVSSTTLSSFVRTYNSSSVSLLTCAKSPSAPGVNIKGAFGSQLQLNKSTSSNADNSNAFHVVSPKPISSIVFTWSTAPTATATSSGTYDAETSTWTAPNTSTTDVSLYNRGSSSATCTQIVVNFVTSGGGGSGATKYDVNIGAMSNGSVTASPTSQEEGENVTLTVSPSAGYELSGDVTVTGDESGDGITATDNGDGTWTFEMPGEEVTVDASFSLIDYTVAKTLTNCAVKEGSTAIPATMNYGDDLSTIIEPTSGNLLPPTITVSGVTSYTWNAGTGALTLTDVTGNVSITIPAAAPQTGSGATVTYTMITTSGTTASYTSSTFSNVLSSATPNKNTLVASSTMSGGNGVGVKDGKTTANGTYTAGITSSASDYSAGSTPFAQFSFDVADGYTFTPTGISVPVQPISNDAYFKILVTDGSSTWITTSSSCSAGNLTTITTAPTGGSALSGTVNVKIYCYSQTDAKGYRFGTPITVTGTIAAAPTCPSAYSFHYGPNGGSWETPICFEQVGETHEWNIENFTIPSHANGEFWVGYAGSTNGQSVTKRWTDGLSDTGSGIMNGAMVLLPTNGSIVGQASGATGTLSIWDNSSSKNQYVGFKPDGYAIMYGGNNYAFSETATSNVWETDLLTLPDVSTTYQVGIKTSSSYTTCSHSKSAEALSAPGNTMLKNGKKYIYVNAGIWHSNVGDQKLAVWDAGASAWGNGGDFLTWNGTTSQYEGYVSSSTTTIVLTRIDKNRESLGSSWGDNVYNKTADITLTALDNEFSISNSDWGSGTTPYTARAHAHPATGDVGKFRMYDNSNDANWYVHWIPYYKLSYDGNGGTGSVAAQYRNSELGTSPLSVAGNGFTREGWRFAGWNTNKYGTGIDYAPGDNIDITGDQTLYAKWERDIYLQSDVSWWYNDNAWFAVYCFDSEHDTNYKWVSMTRAEECSSPAVYKVALPGNNFDKVIFVRMNKNKASLEWTSKDNQTTNITYPDLAENEDLFTISNGDDGNACTGTWGTYSVPTYTITFAGNSNTGGSMSDISSIACDANQTITANAFTKTGYSFAGWTANVNVTIDDATVTAGTVIDDEKTIQNIRSNITLTAQWSQIMVSSITLDPTSKTLTIDETQTITPTVLPTTALDKTVTWSSSNSNVASVSSSGVVTAKAPGSATITATANDGSGVTGTCSITVNKIQPTKYDFAVDKTVLCGEETATLTLEDSEDGVTYELREDSSTPIAETQKTGTGSALTWTGLGAGNYVVYAVADATYTERQMNGSKITVSTGTTTSITTGPTSVLDAVVGSATSLSVTAAGTDLSYQWKQCATVDGTYANVASGGTSATYNVTPSVAGTIYYKVVVTGTCGTVTSSAVSIVATDPVLYTVTFDANGGTIDDKDDADVTQATEGGDITLPTPDTRTNYTFEGWYVGSKIGDAGDDDYEPEADETAYARWQEDCAGGEDETLASAYVTSGYDIAATVGSATKSNWSTNEGEYEQVGSTTEYANKFNSTGYVRISPKAGSSYAAGDKVYIRIYNGNTDSKSINVAFLQNDDSTKTELSATSITKKTIHEFEYTLTASEIHASGYIQIMRGVTNGNHGWFVAARVVREGGSGTCYYVTYDGNGAETGLTSDPKAYAKNDDPEVLDNGDGGSAYTKSGYTFTGWNTMDVDDGTGTAYAPGATITDINDNITLYAQWSYGSGYSITYHCNDATSGCPSGVAVATNLPDPLPSAPTKTGYEFGGWYTDSEFTEEAVAGATLDADANLYAKWCMSISPTLTYSKNIIWLDDETLTATPTLDKKGSTGSVTYESSDATVVDVNESTGTITAKKRGSATITATIAEGGGKCEAEATCEIKVKSVGCTENVLASATRKSGSENTMENGTGSNYSASGIACESTGKLGTNDKHYMYITLTGTTLQDGDVVVINLNTVGDVGDGAIHLFAGTTSGSTEIGTKASPTTGDNEVILSGVPDDTYSVTMYRTSKNQNHRVDGIKVKRQICPDIKIFDAADNDSWSDNDNWVQAGEHGADLPTNEDRVYIKKSVTVDTDEAAAARVHITDGSTLTVKESVTMGDVEVQTGSTLNVSVDGEDNGVTFTVNSLSLKGGLNSSCTAYDMPRVYINSKSSLEKSESTVNFDISVDQRHYYPFAVPFKVEVKDVNYANSTLAKFAKYGATGQYVIKEYDGAGRAKNGAVDANWKVVPNTAGTYLYPGKGYVLTAVSLPAYGGGIIRFPLSFTDDWTTLGEQATVDEVTKNQVSVEAYEGTATEGGKNSNKGWNMLGVPYMSCFASKGNYAHDAEDGFIKGKLNFITGEYTEKTSNVYVTVPTSDFSEYLQFDFDDADTKLLPGWCFFVQVDKDGTITFEDDGQTNSSSLPIYAPKREQEMPTVKTGIILSSETASDKTTILVSDKYSVTDYEINADLEKMFGNGYTLATYSLAGTTRLAYNAMSRADAANVIPIGYRAPAEGEYTFAINPRYVENGDFERIDLIDYETGFVTNLLQSSYTFTSDRTQSDSRFALNVVPQKETPTDVEPVTGDGLPVTGARKVIIDNKIYIIRGGRMYDATGRMVK